MGDPVEEPLIASTPSEPARGRARHEARPTAGELFKHHRWTKALLVAFAACALIGLAALAPAIHHLSWILLGLVAFGIFGTSLAANVLPVSMVGVVVGSDGILVRG